MGFADTWIWIPTSAQFTIGGPSSAGWGRVTNSYSGTDTAGRSFSGRIGKCAGNSNGRGGGPLRNRITPPKLQTGRILEKKEVEVRLFFKTFGCRSNLYDTQLMEEVVLERGWQLVPEPGEGEVAVVNSCTVTNRADRDLRRYLRHLRRNYPNLKIVVTGCGAYPLGEELYSSRLADLVLGHQFKEELPNWLDREGVHLGDFQFVNRRLLTRISTTKAFLKIQEGCDFQCGYCIIPAVRGPARSVPMEQVVRQVELLVGRGVREVVLTGINLGSWGKEWGVPLSQLVERLIKIPRLKRLRLGSLEPSQLDRRLEELLESEVLEKHLHIPLQHTSDRMLRLMNRRNRVSTTLPLFHRLAEKGVALGTDFIVGHPGESREVWEEALSNFKEYPITHLHLFTYSPRRGTRSAELPGRVPGPVARERGELLRQIVAKKNLQFRKRWPVPLLVHIEQRKGEYWTGYDQFYNRVFIPAQPRELGPGQWVEVRKYQIKKDGNYAEEW
jgi:MiaB-like tRNA modifying enzyme